MPGLVRPWSSALRGTQLEQGPGGARGIGRALVRCGGCLGRCPWSPPPAGRPWPRRDMALAARQAAPHGRMRTP
eukprot:9176848-Lingulodinium_polyedra.AAC.1